MSKLLVDFRNNLRPGVLPESAFWSYDDGHTPIEAWRPFIARDTVLRALIKRHGKERVYWRENRILDILEVAQREVYAELYPVKRGEGD